MNSSDRFTRSSRRHSVFQSAMGPRCSFPPNPVAHRQIGLDHPCPSFNLIASTSRMLPRYLRHSTVYLPALDLALAISPLLDLGALLPSLRPQTTQRET